MRRAVEYSGTSVVFGSNGQFGTRFDLRRQIQTIHRRNCALHAAFGTGFMHARFHQFFGFCRVNAGDFFFVQSFPCARRDANIALVAEFDYAIARVLL
jgi:hypothetical protein